MPRSRFPINWFSASPAAQLFCPFRLRFRFIYDHLVVILWVYGAVNPYTGYKAGKIRHPLSFGNCLG